MLMRIILKTKIIRYIDCLDLILELEKFSGLR